jgi:NADH:ubiquinone oxidoreductase subunit C
VQRLLADIPGTSWQWRHGYVEVKVPREHLLVAARLLRDAGLDYLSFVTEVDWRDRFEMLYHLFSYDYQKQPLGVVLRTDLPREDSPEVASLTAVWPGAEFMERECAEMMGIRFLGHPDLRKILLPEDFTGFPMRKDYETDFEYITVKKLVHELDPDFASVRKGRSSR